MALYNLSNAFLEIRVNSFGAELCSVISKDEHIEYVWQANPAIWPRHAPNLFPVVGKLKDGIFLYNDGTYTLPQHGFARDNEFICVEESADKLCFEFVANEKTLVNFPFHFSLQISYSLTGNKLSVEYSVFNPDSGKLYFSVGAHPAFNCPLQSNETFEDYELLFNNKQQLTLHKLKEGLITPETETIKLKNNALALTQSLFDTDAIVLKNKQSDVVTLISKKSKHGVKLSAIGWPYYGIWTKPGTSEFICLEPWYGIADSTDSTRELENKEGIVDLDANQTFTASFDIDFF